MIKKYIKPLTLSLISYISIILIFKNISMLILISIVPLFFLFNKQKFINSIYVYLPAFILTIFLWIYNSLQFIWSNSFVVFKLIFVPIGLFLFFVFFISFIFSLFNKIKTLQHISKHNKYRLLLIAFSIIIVSWIPLWIAEYPNTLDPDTVAQFSQIFNLEPYSNGNPLIHTLFIKILFSFFSLFTKDINLNIALISIVLMIINALVFAYTSAYVYLRTSRLYTFVISIIFFAFTSYNVSFGIQISKDTTFTLSMIMFIISIDKFLIKQNCGNVFSLLLWSILFSLLRKNGYYILAGTAVLILPFIKNRKYMKLGLLLISFLIFSTIIQKPIYNQITSIANKDLPVKKNNNKGIMPSVKNIIPLQQISYIVYREWDLTDKQKYLITKLAPLDKIKENYNMYWVDPMLNTCEKYGDSSLYKINKIEYFKMYFELFAKHPFDFIESYYAMTGTYFYPFVRCPHATSKIMTDNQFGFKKIRLVSDKYTRNIEDFYNIQYNIPIIDILHIPGIFTFFYIIVLFYFLYSRQYSKFILITPIILNIAILLTVVPINGEFRYYYPMCACLPLIISFIINKENSNI